MTLSHLPLAALDTETTGVDVHADRIVTASICVIDGVNVHTDEWLLDPGIDIPDGAAQVHGITTDRARADGMDYAEGYAEIRDRLETVWAQGRLIAIMNAAFDLSIIDAEGRRLGYPPLVAGAVLDPFCIDRAVDQYRRGKRTLEALCAHYGVRQADAHQSTGDALAAARLAYVLRQHQALAQYDADDLMAAQAAWHRDRQESYRTWLIGQGRTGDAAHVSTEWPIRRTYETGTQ